MNELIEALFLGIVQGVTEWLPVSSSGHLAIFQNVLGLEQSLAFDVVLHLGSLAAVLIVMYSDIKNLLIGLLKKDEKSLKMAGFLILATIPIILTGFFLKDYVSSFFLDLRAISFAFLFTGSLLFLSRYPKNKIRKINLKNSLVIGLFQSIAILPGVSRSGSTISIALIQGVKNEDAAKFSFLLVIPAILGATLSEAKNITQISAPLPAIIGFLTSVIIGVLSLRLLVKIIKNNKFDYFSVYCFLMFLITFYLSL